jgi:hypothetical protein
VQGKQPGRNVPSMTDEQMKKKTPRVEHPLVRVNEETGAKAATGGCSTAR